MEENKYLRERMKNAARLIKEINNKENIGKESKLKDLPILQMTTFSKELWTLEEITKEVKTMYENTQYFLNLPYDMNYQRKEIAKIFICSKAIYDVASIIADREVDTHRSAFHELVEASIANAINEMKQLIS